MCAAIGGAIFVAAGADTPQKAQENTELAPLLFSSGEADPSKSVLDLLRKIEIEAKTSTAAVERVTGDMVEASSSSTRYRALSRACVRLALRPPLALG